MTKPVVSKDFNLEDIRKDLIRQLLKDMPESKNLLEYEDYRQHPTIGNASEFITQSLERNLDMAAMKENYVDYLVNRPHVERIGEHDLFTDAGKPVVLADIQREVVDHKGPVWTHVVSLRREDAARLGYDSIPTMVRELGMSRSIIKRALGDLVSAGYLKRSTSIGRMAAIRPISIPFFKMTGSCQICFFRKCDKFPLGGRVCLSGGPMRGSGWTAPKDSL